MSRLAVLIALALAGCAAWARGYPDPDPARWRVEADGAHRVGPAQPDCRSRGTLELAQWAEARLGTRVDASPAAALGLAVATEATLPLALDGDVRVGPWLQVGGDTLDWFDGRGGLAFVFGRLPDPQFVRRRAGTASEGSIELRVGAGWRAFGATDDASHGPQGVVQLTFGSRSHSEIYESGNAYDVCQPGARRGHFGPGVALGARVFVELQRSFDAPTSQVVIGVELDPFTLWLAHREATARDL